MPCQPGRGFWEAAAILGADYAGVLVRDGWAPYRRFTDAAHQTCLAHLLRRARDLARDHPRAPFAARVTITLQQALGIRDRRVAGVISPHGAAVARGHVLTHLFTALDHVGSVPDMQRFAAHLSTELPALFSFLFDPAVDATNWRAEHALRPAVVNRKVCGGNRSARGAHTQQVLTSVLRTAQQRQLDASERPNSSSGWKSTVGCPGSSGGPLGSVSRHRKLFRLAQASNWVPSTVKCSSESRPAARAWARTASKNAAATSPASSRSRFFVNVVGCQTGSSIFNPTNHRNKRL